ncbi:FAS-associated factor 2-like [Rhopilema esculentum]|uniref:FAS-associated factor 2-like n=1 Tax=Rhopilema esculentum TaxID=499914 RepID=UPI0031D14F53
MAPPTEENSEQDETDDLTEEQHSKLVQFQEVTGTDCLEESKQKLIQYNWNLELAVHASFNESEGIPPPPQYDEIENEEDTVNVIPSFNEPLDGPVVRTGISSLANNRRMSWTEWLVGLVLVPYRFTYNTIRDFITYIIRIVWPSFGRGSGDPIEDVLQFKRQFEDNYGLEHPTLYQGTYSQALSDAKKELRFLLVYLHSGSHQDTPTFCKDVLCNPGFKEYINGNMLFWGCDVNTCEGHRVSKAVRETTYPFLAVICLRDNRMTIVWRIEGFMPVDQLIALLSRIIAENEPSLIAARAEREERSLSQTIREEQDRAYKVALEQDREKARKKKALEDAKRQEENERRDKEMEKQRQVEVTVKRKADCRQRLEEIPEPDNTVSDAIQIRIKLPNGVVLCRRFLTSDQFELLVDFVFGHEDTPKEFALNSNFPRKTFQTDSNTNQTLAEVGLSSSAVLFVQNLTEDSSDED